MSNNDPLPLIRSSETFLTEDELEYKDSAYYGYLLVGLTWALFVVTINSSLKCWKWVIKPLKTNASTEELHATITYWCEVFDYFVISCWCIYVVAWWWALFSWIGLKLFRHSKGIQAGNG